MRSDRQIVGDLGLRHDGIERRDRAVDEAIDILDWRALVRAKEHREPCAAARAGGAASRAQPGLQRAMHEDARFERLEGATFAAD